jgi:hypothetical protein
MSDCFWILVDGRIVIPDNKHILAVVSAPELFGESGVSIIETFQKHGQNENSNIESKAREDVLLRVISRNHIRIRKNILKQQQHWSIQLYRLTDERRASISSWAKYVATDGDQFADVIIHQLFDNFKIQTSLNHLAGSTVDEAPVILRQTGLLGNFK